MTTSDRLYHVGFGTSDLPEGTTIALLSGDPERSEHIAMDRLTGGRALSRKELLELIERAAEGIGPV